MIGRQRRDFQQLMMVGNLGVYVRSRRFVGFIAITDKVIIILQIQFAYVQLINITETCVTKQSFKLFLLNNFS